MVRQIAILLFQIVLAIGLGIAGIRIASLVNGEATSAPASLAANTELLWTTSPVRVDPRSQNYERIPTPPDLYPIKMHADQRLRVISSNRFTFKGQEFRLAACGGGRTQPRLHRPRRPPLRLRPQRLQGAGEPAARQISRMSGGGGGECAGFPGVPYQRAGCAGAAAIGDDVKWPKR